MATTYLVFVLDGDGAYRPVASTEKNGPVTSAREVDEGKGGTYLVVPERSAHFVNLAEEARPPVLKATELEVELPKFVPGQVSIDEVLAEGPPLPTSGPGPVTIGSPS